MLKKNLYTTIVKPKVEYAISTCDPLYNCDVEKLERVQRYAAPYCTGDYPYTSSVTGMLQKLQLQPLEKAEENLTLTFLYKIVHIVDVAKQSYLRLSKETRTRNVKSSNYKYLY